MERLVPFLRIFFLFVFFFGATGFTLGQKRVRIHIRAFIPSEHPGNPGYVRPIPAQAGQFAIPAPRVVPPTCTPAVTGDSSCFLTDHRVFNNNPNASARAVTEFILVIDGNTVTVERADGREVQRTMPTHKVNCNTGNDLVPSQTASTANMHIGTPAIAAGIVQIVVDGRASNPLVTPSPDVQYGGTFTFNTQTNTLRFVGSTKVFPAYEAYAQLNDGPIVTLFQSAPGPNSTVCDLIDFGSGLQLRSVDTTVTLPDNVAGTWESTDADRRFRLEIIGTSVNWNERGTSSTTPGAMISRTVPLSISSTKFRIERPNDVAVLTFLGFQPQSLRDAILARNPSPSFIVFSRTGNVLSAEWSGLVVTKNPDGTLRDVIQPGVRPPGKYTFNRLP
jgi:hypothetical protein